MILSTMNTPLSTCLVCKPLFDFVLIHKRVVTWIPIRTPKAGTNPKAIKKTIKPIIVAHPAPKPTQT